MASFTYYGGGCVCSRDKCSDDCKTYRNYKPKPITNADRIRAMTDEELAKGLAEIFDCVACETMFDMKCRCHHEFFSCWQAWLDWLKKEATNDQNNS